MRRVVTVLTLSLSVLGGVGCNDDGTGNSDEGDPTSSSDGENTDLPTSSDGQDEESGGTEQGDSDGEDTETGGDSGDCGDDCPEMVDVPAGSFWRGCNESAEGDYCGINEKPYREITLAAFKIDRLETTVGEYLECVEAEACAAVDTWCLPINQADPESAMSCVAWQDAHDYCAWKGKRLPTEAEWEKAARGDDGRVYPWGNTEPNCQLAALYDPDEADGCLEDVDFSAVGGLKPDGVSPYGAMDMAGNVAEWVADYFDPDYYMDAPDSDPTGPETGERRILRGGGRTGGADDLRVASRGDAEPAGTGATGIRCAQDG